ncbi:MAG: hypothetical protein IJL62_05545 [Clostridia bacterium]|nr:hypothetical protein [Clostridia bacterium]
MKLNLKKTRLYRRIALFVRERRMGIRRFRLFADRDRVTRTRIAYIALTAGTVVVALLLVLLNRGIFKLSEKRLYDDPKYEAVSIISANGIGAPLSLETRVKLYLGCERQGEERAVMPGEMSETEVTEKLRELWSDTLRFHAPDGRLKTGESVDSVLKKSRYSLTLRDFYNDTTGAKLALWCGQAYYDAGNGKVYCLSVQFDSRTGEAYSLSAALFGNVQPDRYKTVAGPFLTANGYADTLAEKAVFLSTEKGYAGTLTLPGGLNVAIGYDSDEQYTIGFTE